MFYMQLQIGKLAVKIGMFIALARDVCILCILFSRGQTR
jgi:hypothetical protein